MYLSDEKVTSSLYVCNRAESRRREARREMFTTPELVTTRRSILGPLAEGRPVPSVCKHLEEGPICIHAAVMLISYLLWVSVAK